jgi:phosphate transport system substrate-binding protein
MNLKHMKRQMVVGLILSLSASHLHAEGLIRIDGSSTVYPITEAVAEEFQQKNAGFKVTVGISGTGGGFKKFCRGETDISDASRPISKKEIDACWESNVQYIELPIGYDALTVVMSKNSTFLDTIKVEELKKMWEPSAQGSLTRWNQINSAWPDQKMALFGPGSDSGTFDYFTEAINGKSKASRGDYTASEDDNVLVQGVSKDPHALGYFGFAYYIENQDKLKALKVDAGKGAVGPSAETVENANYAPLSRPIFIYVSKKAIKRPEVKQFVDYYIANAARLVKEVKYVPLDGPAYSRISERFNAGKTGTAFGGKNAVGLSIHQILDKRLAS